MVADTKTVFFDENMKTSSKPDEYLNKFGSSLCYSLALFLAHETNFKYALAEVELLAAEGASRFEGRSSEHPQIIRETIERLAAVRSFSAGGQSGPQPADSNNTACGDPPTSNSVQGTLHQMVLSRIDGRRPTERRICWAINEAKELVRLIDEHHGVSTSKEHQAQNVREPALTFRDQ